MTIYERTNVIGLRLEQLAFGAPPLLNESELEKCTSLKDIAKLEDQINAVNDQQLEAANKIQTTANSLATSTAEPENKQANAVGYFD